MKNLSTALVLGCLVLTSSANAAPVTRPVFEQVQSLAGLKTQFGLLEFVEGDLSAPAPGRTSTEVARDFLKANRAVLPGNPVADFDLRSVDTDTPGFTHVVYGQKFKGLPVYDSHLVVSMKGENQVYRSWGKLFPVPHDFDVEASISYQDAEDLARMDFGRDGAWLEEESELVIAPAATQGEFNLAYRVHLFEDATDIAKNMVYLMDAHTGEVLHIETRICTGTPAVGSGIGVWGDTKSLKTYNTGTTYTLQDSTRAMYNASTNKGWISTYSTAYSSSAPYSSASDNYWDSTGQPSEVDAHYYAGVVYEYYRTVHGRNSYDNKGSDLKSYTHSSNVNNAFWSGSYMEYGDGDGTNFYPFAGDLSVAAHEMTHGVTQYGANLKYEYQSGALNEAFSDIMAKLELDTDNWLIGDQVATPTFMATYDVWALRDMQDPTFGGLYNPASPMSTYAQPDHQSVYAYLKNGVLTDYGGVHVNSGIINKWAQILTDGGSHYGVSVTGIGRAKVAKIVYRVNSAAYLSTTSDFDHFATQIQAATKDLYGASSAEVNSVIQALRAVGLLSVGCVTLNETESNGTTSTANPITTSCTDAVGSMGSTTDKDYFKVTLPAGKTLKMFLRVPYNCDYDLYLYKGSSQVAKSINAGNGIDEPLSYTNGSTSTTYYLMVKRYAGSTGTNYKYTLNTSWN